MLDAYQDYWDELVESSEYEYSWKCTLAYVDDNNIPECFVQYEDVDNRYSYTTLLFYKNGKVYEFEDSDAGLGYVAYIDKKNIICTGGMYGSYVYNGYHKWVNSSATFEKIGCSVIWNGAGEYHYYIGIDAATQSGKGVSKEKYDDYNDSFGKDEDYGEKEIIYDTVQEAYEAIK